MTPRAAAVAGVLLLARCAGLRSAPTRAVADLEDARGQRVGVATFDEVAAGVRIVVEVRGQTPGEHGVHVHEVGRCEPPGFTSAGGHFNPERKQHGLENPAGPHAGDLPNLTVAADGTGRLETTTGRITLGGGPASVFDGDGSALVIHAARDDMRTDPTGNSGVRAACGVIVAR